MTIAIIGNDVSFNEAQAKLGMDTRYIHAYTFNPDLASKQYDAVFDFNTDWSAETISAYATVNIPVFLNTVFSTLAACTFKTNGPVFGFCGLPTFFNRGLVEVTSLEENKVILEKTMNAVGLSYKLIKDQLGMVTPRVVCMIINEAYEVLQQGVASREDIDLSMKLGTNYPFGPFEWAERIGIENVRKLLERIKVSEIFVL